MRAGSRIRSIPPGLLGALVLAFAVEATLARRALDFAPPLAVQYRAAAEGVRLGRVAEVVCFGDSLIKVGVLPRVIGEATGRPAYNLAILGGQPTTAYFLLRRALDRGARPRAVLVGFTAHALECDPRAATRGLNEIVTPAEALDLAQTARDPSLCAAMLLARAVPSIRARIEIRANLGQALRGEVPTTRYANILHLRNWAANQGSQVSAPPAAVAAAPTPATGPAGPATWNVHRLNATYVRRFLELADSRGIAVYWLLSPIRPDAQANLERTGIDGLHARFVRRLQVAFPRMVVVDGRHSGYGHALFSDPIHLHRQGALACSEGIAEILAGTPAATAGPRWVELAPYRDARAGAAVEDMAQSIAALRAPATRRR